MAGEGEAGAEEERAGLEGPGGEGGDEACGLEWVLFVVVGLQGGKVGGDEAERVVLGADVEEVVGLGLPLLYNVPARRALRYGAAGAGGGAPPLRQGAVRALHCASWEL